MALNSTSGLQIEGWRTRMQPYFQKTLVGNAICDTEIGNDLKQGKTVHYPQFSSASAQSYTPGSDISLDTFSSTDETLTVDQYYVVGNTVDDVESLQSNYKQRSEIRERSAYKLRDEVDKDVMGHYTDASLTVDGGDVGGTSGSAITASTGNVLNVFTAARKKLQQNNIPENGDLFAIVTPAFAEKIQLGGFAQGFNLADRIFKKGYAGSVSDFDVYVSNNVQNASYNGASSDRMLFGKKGAISLAVQRSPSVQVKEKEKQLGVNIFVYSVWGTKVFTQLAKQLIDVPVDDSY